MKRFWLLREFYFYKTNASLLFITLSFTTLLMLFAHWSGLSGASVSETVNLLSLFGLFGVFLTVDHLFKEEIDGGALEVYFLQRTSFLKIALMRFLSYGGIVLVPLSFLITLYAALLSHSSFDGLFFVCVLVFFICYALVAMGASVLTHGADKQKALVFLICLPLIIPIFLTQTYIFSTLGEGQDILPCIKSVGGLVLFELPVNLTVLTLGLNMAMKLK